MLVNMYISTGIMEVLFGQKFCLEKWVVAVAFGSSLLRATAPNTKSPMIRAQRENGKGTVTPSKKLTNGYPK